ncbi:MAG: rod shape-determining protein MreD [Firmicutes bacterium]|nr:rod shape-determining protein MreD [Bacillota bacterium]
MKYGKVLRLVSRVLTLFFAVALESAVIPRFAPPGVHADLVLILVILYSLDRGLLAGLGWGLAGGLLEDMLAGGVIGISALSKVTCGYLAGAMHEILFRDNLVVPTLLVAMTGIIKVAITLGLCISLGMLDGSLLHFIRVEIYSLLLTVFLTPAVAIWVAFSGNWEASHVGTEA